MEELPLEKVQLLYPGTVKVYGPYIFKDGRRRVSLYDGKKNLCKTYARVLYEVAHNIRLPTEIEVDHIDDNKLNDSLDNLQILPKAVNARKSSKPGREVWTLQCNFCGKDFTRQARRVRDKLKQGIKRLYCGRICRDAGMVKR